jgi:hypothetical protein
VLDEILVEPLAAITRRLDANEAAGTTIKRESHAGGRAAGMAAIAH